MRHRFQFRISNLLLAMFWVAVWFGAYGALKHIYYLELELGHNSQWPKGPMLIFILAVVPFSAVGALFGRSWHATAVGASLVLAFIVTCSLLPQPQ